MTSGILVSLDMGFIRTNAQHLFPNVVERSQFNRRTRYLSLAITCIRQKLLDKLDAHLEQWRVIDITDVQSSNLAGRAIPDSSEAKPPRVLIIKKKTTYYGFKLFVMAVLERLLAGLGLFLANINDRICADEVLEFHSNIVVIGDKGFLDKGRALWVRSIWE